MSIKKHNIVGSVNYTHKRPLRGHCAPPLHERANQSAPTA
ncbi:hypothetical protein SELSPUOL_00381 [Selenomonas sputigena ATCC 35185]|uniref:Uncharacterized protein n=1 Tax=Selenomonas sputigena (strain ATCC 35185 / DSM 20758 / CCUG 44933 / VPI D19B-28) TaxID=546271 RepID=C9LSF7_SELS3|nr:hypothetical protein SELSPUOL_00381 [Selenomonas sputigena ATCC 35185]